MNIAVVGVGYVGLVTGACLADVGHRVACVDTDANKIANLTKGKLPIFEVGLEAVVERGMKKNALTFTTSVHEAVSDAEVVMLCVGTPPRHNGAADLSFVIAAAEDIGRALHHYVVVVSKSTVPVGTTRRVKKIIAKNYSGAFDVASNPEFLREGSAVHDFQNPDRIVFGVETDRARECMERLYASFGCPKVMASLESSEMIKYASNAFLATKISFVNEIAQVCETVGADVDDVSKGMGLDARIGPQFLKAGVGYGGSCFPKDVRALHHMAGTNGHALQLLRSVIDVNNAARWAFFQKIKNVLGSFEGKRIAVWGLSFKANTDDTRESIALDIIERMCDEGADVVAYDPQAHLDADVLARFARAPSAMDAVKNANALVLMTEWDEFRDADLLKLKQQMMAPLVFDGRNVFSPERMREAGISYVSVGRILPCITNFDC